MTVTIQQANWTTYDVQGQTLEEVARNIEQLQEAGQTHWDANYQVTEWGQGNDIVKADVTVTVSVSMPNWPGVTSRPQAEQDEWNRFVEALREHEQGHIDLANQYLENADTLIEGYDEDTAKRQWQENLSALQQASDGYDGQNDHGRNSGTTIELPESSDDEAETEEVTY
jgi:predicted secreted Zn-dependent protease